MDLWGMCVSMCKVVELAGEGSVNNGTTMSIFCHKCQWYYLLHTNKLQLGWNMRWLPVNKSLSLDIWRFSVGALMVFYPFPVPLQSGLLLWTWLSLSLWICLSFFMPSHTNFTGIHIHQDSSSSGEADCRTNVTVMSYLGCLNLVLIFNYRDTSWYCREPPDFFPGKITF